MTFTEPTRLARAGLMILVVAIALTACGRRGDPEAPVAAPVGAAAYPEAPAA